MIYSIEMLWNSVLAEEHFLSLRTIQLPFKGSHIHLKTKPINPYFAFKAIDLSLKAIDFPLKTIH